MQELRGAKYGTLLYRVVEKRLAVYYLTSFYLALNYGSLSLHNSEGKMFKDKVSGGFGPSFCIIKINYEILKINFLKLEANYFTIL